VCRYKITLKNYISNYRNKFDCCKDIIIEYYVMIIISDNYKSQRLIFTSSEYFDMLVLYRQCNESATVAAQEYAVRFPNRERPSRNTIT
jgi:hypothetical protein